VSSSFITSSSSLSSLKWCPISMGACDVKDIEGKMCVCKEGYEGVIMDERLCVLFELIREGGCT